MQFIKQVIKSWNEMPIFDSYGIHDMTFGAHMPKAIHFRNKNNWHNITHGLMLSCTQRLLYNPSTCF